METNSGLPGRPGTGQVAPRGLQHGDGAGVFVRTSRGEVHVVVDGDPAAPAFCAIHGLPGSTRDFRSLALDAARRGLCAVRLDLPGFGRSPSHREGGSSSSLLATPAERAHLIAEVMAARGHRRFAVVGHSFGGTAALATAALHPDRVTALVMVNSVGVTRHRGLQLPHELIAQVQRLARLPVIGERVLGLLRQSYGRMGLKSDRPLDTDDLLDHTRIIGGLDFADLRQLAARVRCPALVVSARDDKLVEPLVAFTLAAALASSSSSSSAALQQQGPVSHRHLGAGGHFLQKRDAPAIASWLEARLLSAA